MPRTRGRRTRREDKGTAVIYVRISQDREKKGEGVENQAKACRELCEHNGWTVVETYIDNDISAAKGKVRPQFEQLLEDKPERVVVWATDRFVRLVSELERVIALDLNVHAVTAGPNSLDLSTSMGRMNARIVTTFAQREGEQKAERQQLQSEARADKGIPFWSRRPFGYNREDQTVREDEAAMVRAAYASVLAGVGIHAIAKDWNARGVLTTRGNPWVGQTVGQLLASPRNAGLLVFRGVEERKGTWEAIVPEATFRAVAAVLSRPERRTGGTGRRTRLLTGVAVCGQCGVTVKGGAHARTGPFKGEATYTCANGCFLIPEPFADRLVLAAMPDVLVEHVQLWATFTDQDDDNGAALATEREQLTERLDALADDYADGILTREQMQRGTLRARERVAQIDSELATAGEAASFAGQLADVEYVWSVLLDDKNKDEARALIGAVCSVVMHPRGKGSKGLRDDLVQITAKKRVCCTDR